MYYIKTMSVLSKIKYQYNLKILEDLISSNNLHEFFDSLEKQKKNIEVYKQLVFNLCPSVLLNCSEDHIKNKIIWLSSFMKEDTSYISTFINFYIKNVDTNIDDVVQYEEILIDVLKKISKIEKLTFLDFIEYSYLYQYLILKDNGRLVNIIKNHLPFFSTPKSLNFTKNTFTKSYVYIVDHPYDVYTNIKNTNHGDQEIAKNIFLNLDGYSSYIKINDVDVEINKQGWHTHILSWTDPNVINSLNGKIILKKDLIENPYETFSSLILHFIQSGLNIKMDYNLIKIFVENNPLEKISRQINISQKEMKFIDKYTNDIVSLYNFDK